MFKDWVVLVFEFDFDVFWMVFVCWDIVNMVWFIESDVIVYLF